MTYGSSLVANQTSDVVVRCECDEPHGTVTREVRPLSLSLDNLKRVWELSKRYDTLFGEEVAGDFSRFIQLFVQESPGGLEATGLFWVVDDFVGVFYMTHIIPEIDALVHYSFFDGRHRGRIELSRAMLKFAFEKYRFVRLSAHVPLYATKHAFTFAESVGFKKEGRVRKIAYYRGEYFDRNIYGILRREALRDGNERKADNDS
jgi:RimJ/RimL family protein N-acetyltransferase